MIGARGMVIRTMPLEAASPEIFQHGEPGIEKRERPDEGRNPVGDLKRDEGHLEHAGDQRNDRPYRPEEAAKEDRPGAVLLEEGLATLDHLRIAGERPYLVCGVLDLQPDPIGDP